MLKTRPRQMPATRPRTVKKMFLATTASPFRVGVGVAKADDGFPISIYYNEICAKCNNKRLQSSDGFVNFGGSLEKRTGTRYNICIFDQR